MDILRFWALCGVEGPINPRCIPEGVAYFESSLRSVSSGTSRGSSDLRSRISRLQSWRMCSRSCTNSSKELP